MKRVITKDLIQVRSTNINMPSCEVLKNMSVFIFTHQNTSQVLLISWLRILQGMQCQVLINSLMKPKSSGGTIIWTGKFLQSQEKISLIEYILEPDSVVAKEFGSFIRGFAQRLLPTAEDYFRGIWKVFIYDLHEDSSATYFTLCNPLLQNRVVYRPSASLSPSMEQGRGEWHGRR